MCLNNSGVHHTMCTGWIEGGGVDRRYTDGDRGAGVTGDCGDRHTESRWGCAGLLHSLARQQTQLQCVRRSYYYFTCIHYNHTIETLVVITHELANMSTYQSL